MKNRIPKPEKDRLALGCRLSGLYRPPSVVGSENPDYMAEITTLVQTAGSTMGEILSAGGMMLVCSLGSLAASVVTAICAARIAATLGATLRGRLFSKVQSFSMEEIGRFSTASSSPAPPTT